MRAVLHCMLGLEVLLAALPCGVLSATRYGSERGLPRHDSYCCCTSGI